MDAWVALVNEDESSLQYLRLKRWPTVSTNLLDMLSWYFPISSSDGVGAMLRRLVFAWLLQTPNISSLQTATSEHSRYLQYVENIGQKSASMILRNPLTAFVQILMIRIRSHRVMIIFRTASIRVLSNSVITGLGTQTIRTWQLPYRRCWQVYEITILSGLSNRRRSLFLYSCTVISLFMLRSLIDETGAAKTAISF